jgi:death-on-curing family protein
MSFYIPDFATVEELHEIVLEVSGGRRGIHDKKLILSAVERPSTYIQYINNFDLDTICALLVDGLARYHGFKDGNKRTALMTVIFTYRLNKVHFKANAKMNREFDGFVIWIVKRKPEVEEITTRLKELRKEHQGSKENWGNILTYFLAQARKHKNEDSG